MLAYAPRPQRQRLNPAALSLIIGVHVLAIGAVMSAKMDVIRQKMQPTIVELIPQPKPPEEPKQQQQPPREVPRTTYTAPDPVMDPPPMPGPAVDPLPQPPLPGPMIGPGIDPAPKPLPLTRSGPRFATPDEDIRPPYPESKRRQDEEALLRLRLSIDERGRVVSVEPVGRTDPIFLEAARRHILKAWRYRPAMEGDQAIASSTVITLKFELD